jgi:glycosyltransferase involved in cell wall biosynthesis
MRESLRIGIFHLGFFYSGGGERLVLEEAIGLSDRGHEVEIFSPVVDKRCFPELQKQVVLKPLLPQLPRWIYDRETLLVLVSCLTFPLMAFRFRKFDVFLGANQPGPWFCWWLKKLFLKPYLIYLAQPTRILYPREIDREVGLRARRSYSPFIQVFKLLRPLVCWADRLSIKEADAMLVNGEYAKENIKKVYSREGVVCPAGTHPANIDESAFKARFRGGVRVNGHSVNKPYVLLTNRHFQHKKFEYALEALKRLDNRRVRLIVTGEKNRYTKSLEKLARSKGLDKQVFFVGLVSERDLERLYRQAACYVYTAPDEDFGMGIVEAMGFGVPVVAWNRGGPATIMVDGETGYLVPVGNIEEYSKSVTTLLENKKLNEKMGLAGKRRALNGFSYERHNSILEQALLKLVKS